MTRVLSPLVHDRAGSGEPVVLIHGIGHRRQAWGPVFDLLAETHEVVRLDLAGFGESAGYPRGVPYNMHNACEHLAANFAEWGLERPHVVGNSLGGAISLELARRRLVSSATALSPAGFFGRLDRAWPLAVLSVMKLSATAPDPVLRRVAASARARRAIGSLLYAYPERIDAERMYGDSLAMKHASAFFPTIREGVRYELDTRGIEVPVTVAWGTKDRVLFHRQAAEARRRLPDAEHVDLPGSGHVPMTDDPERIVEIVAATVARAGRAPGAADSAAS